jgi:hypothetical protein
MDPHAWSSWWDAGPNGKPRLGLELLCIWGLTHLDFQGYVVDQDSGLQLHYRPDSLWTLSVHCLIHHRVSLLPQAICFGVMMIRTVFGANPHSVCRTNNTTTHPISLVFVPLQSPEHQKKKNQWPRYVSSTSPALQTCIDLETQKSTTPCSPNGRLNVGMRQSFSVSAGGFSTHLHMESLFIWN